MFFKNIKIEFSQKIMYSLIKKIDDNLIEKSYFKKIKVLHIFIIIESIFFYKHHF